MTKATIICGDALTELRKMPSDSIHCCVTSPPYWGLRDYGTASWEGGDPICEHNARIGDLRFMHPISEKQSSNAGSAGSAGSAAMNCVKCGARRIDAQIGLELTMGAYLDRMIAVFEEVRRVLHPSGVCFINCGDSYARQAGDDATRGMPNTGQARVFLNGLGREGKGNNRPPDGLKAKDRCLIPFRLAIALQDAGWWVRDVICWCLSGGAWIYAKTQKGEMPMMVRDIARLKPGTVQLWNGEKWTRVLGWSRNPSAGTELELVLRSGERISCTPNHQFPTDRGLLPASQLQVGDVLQSCRLPQPKEPYNPGIATADAAWFVGLYLAEGDRNDDNLRFAGHIREVERWERIQQVAKFFGGSATLTCDGNNQTIRVYGRFLIALVENYINGTTAKNKSLKVRCWSHSNLWLMSLLEGYLSGDGHWDDANNRWRIGFTRNYALERDLRVLAARLGFTLTLNLCVVRNQDGEFPAFRGEIRFVEPSNKKAREEIVEIRKARCREVYDIGVADEPHLFALASGILTHNSKPAPMPESVTDRCTQAWEPILMLTKSARYFFDAFAIAEPSVAGFNGSSFTSAYDFSTKPGLGLGPRNDTATRNARNVWSIGPEPCKDAHFATFPSELPKRCILAATSAKGVCPKCGEPWLRTVETERTFESGSGRAGNFPDGKNGHRMQGGGDTLDIRRGPTIHTKTIGWNPGCVCDSATPIPATVLDPFLGSGTTAAVALELGRNAVGIELNENYVALARQRCAAETPGLQLA